MSLCKLIRDLVQCGAELSHGIHSAPWDVGVGHSQRRYFHDSFRAAKKILSAEGSGMQFVSLDSIFFYETRPAINGSPIELLEQFENITDGYCLEIAGVHFSTDVVIAKGKVAYGGQGAHKSYLDYLNGWVLQRRLPGGFYNGMDEEKAFDVIRAAFNQGLVVCPPYEQMKRSYE